jgi:ABC-type dipeptide/oligopeptide/nickel transport system permease component
VLGAVGLAYAAAIPLGALAAAFRRRRVNVVIMLAVLCAYATPTAVVAVVARRAGGDGVLAAAAVLALALMAAPTAQLRAAVASALNADATRAAVARGASPARALVVHALRSALLPVGTLATREGPMALGGAFVVERVFHLRGVGEATISAVGRHDTGWLMAISIVAALIAALVAVAGDLTAIVIDPRLGPPILARRGRS